MTGLPRAAPPETLLPRSRDAEPSRRSWLSRTLIGLELFLALAGLTGGAMMIIDPTGDLIGLSPSVLEGTPFTDLLLPGIALALVNGLLPLMVAVEALVRGRWAEVGHVVVGAAVLGWMAGQFLLIGYQVPVQIIVTIYGAVLLALAIVNLRRGRA